MARSAGKSQKSPALTAEMRIVVLHGADDMVKRTRLNDLRNALEKTHGEVETYSFDGKTAGLADVLDEIRGYSLIQTYKLVLVDDADQFVKTHRTALERYAAAPVDHATLVFRSGAWHTGKLDKLIQQHGAIVRCDAPTAAQARSWLIARAKSDHQATLSPAAADLLIERLGSNLMMLETEVAKLALMVAPGQPIEPSLVEEAVGRGSEEAAWQVQQAVLQTLVQALQPAPAGRRPPQPAARHLLEKVHELIDLAGHSEVLVMYAVADVVRKLNVAWMLRSAGTPERDIARQLRLWGEQQTLFLQVLRLLSPIRAADLFQRALTADRGAKSGLGEAVRNLECFCAQLAD